MLSWGGNLTSEYCHGAENLTCNCHRTESTTSECCHGVENTTSECCHGVENTTGEGCHGVDKLTSDHCLSVPAQGGPSTSS